MSDWSKEVVSQLEWKDFMWPILSGLCLGFENILYLYSLTWADASKTVGIESTYPLFVIIWSFFFLNERIAPLTYVGIALSLVGSVVLSFDVLKSLYSNITAKYPRFKKRHEQFMLIEKEKREKMAEDAAKKSRNRYYGRFWYPFIKQVDECRMKNYKGDIAELVDRGLESEKYYDKEQEEGYVSEGDTAHIEAFDPYNAPDLVYEEEMEGNYGDSFDDYLGDYDDDEGKESGGNGSKAGEEMSEVANSEVGTNDTPLLVKTNNKKTTKTKAPGHKRPWLLDLIIRNRRVITGLLPIPIIMSGNDFFAKVSVGNMPVNNVSALNTMSFGVVLLGIFFTREARAHFATEFKYNVMFAVFNEALSIFTNYLLILGMSGLSASLVSSLSATRPLFILFFEKLFGLSKDSVHQILAFKLLPIVVVIGGAILMTLSA